jgi:hypothetical protein
MTCLGARAIPATRPNAPRSRAIELTRSNAVGRTHFSELTSANSLQRTHLGEVPSVGGVTVGGVVAASVFVGEGPSTAT